MRKLLFFLSMFCALTANAQPILVTFSGTGGSFSVGSVKVENLMTTESIILTSGQGLSLNVLTGVDQVENNKASQLKFFPNPMTDNSVMQFTPPVEGNATITVSDISGRQIAQIQSYLDKNLQEFRLSGLKHGLWLISVKGSAFQYSGKLISNGKSEGGISIEKVSGNSYVADVKNAKEDPENVKGDADMEYSIDWVNMDYNTGDRLKFTGVSGNYSTVITDIPIENKTITFNFVACTDGDNINYPVVDINGQVWMAENLRTTSYSNNEVIGTTDPADKDITSIESSYKYQWAYDGIESNVTVYGRLYTWFAVTDDRNVCPSGWHVPSDLEWTSLTAYLGGVSAAGGKLKEISTSHWNVANTGATNESGFTALPGGARGVTGIFSDIGQGGYWWSSVQYDILDAFDQLLGYNYIDFVQGSDDKKIGLSVRCIYGTTPSVSTTAVTTFTSTEATVGGDVTFDGNATVTDRGVYWGTSPDPVATGSKFHIGNGTGPFSASLPGLTPNTTYYVKAFATNSLGKSFGEEVFFTTSIAIGDSYQGGIVAYILGTDDIGYDALVIHGLIVAPTDQSTGAPWGCGGTLIPGIGTAIGTGSQNTTAIVDIVTGCATPGIAARLCDELDLNSYSDWYLPSKDELNQLYINRVAIAVIGNYSYLSSSQNEDPAVPPQTIPPGAGYVWGQAFSNGAQSNLYPKPNVSNRVRAIRSF
jgi:uncharacterized protein (TIGR02145 family)